MAMASPVSRFRRAHSEQRQKNKTAVAPVHGVLYGGMKPFPVEVPS